MQEQARHNQNRGVVRNIAQRRCRHAARSALSFLVLSASVHVLLPPGTSKSSTGACCGMIQRQMLGQEMLLPNMRLRVFTSGCFDVGTCRVQPEFQGCWFQEAWYGKQFSGARALSPSSFCGVAHSQNSKGMAVPGQHTKEGAGGGPGTCCRNPLMVCRCSPISS